MCVHTLLLPLMGHEPGHPIYLPPTPNPRFLFRRLFHARTHANEGRQAGRQAGTHALTHLSAEARDLKQRAAGVYVK